MQKPGARSARVTTSARHNDGRGGGNHGDGGARGTKPNKHLRQPTRSHKQREPHRTSSATKTRGIDSQHHPVSNFQPPSLRQRRKRQEEIARENARMEQRLKVIREATPRKAWAERAILVGRGCGGGSRHRPPSYRQQNRRRRGSEEQPHAQLHGTRGQARESIAEAKEAGSAAREDAALLHAAVVNRERTRAIAVETPVCSDNLKTCSGGRHGANQDARPAVFTGQGEEGWRELYKHRQALALAVETAAGEVASVRAQVEALRAKALCTEANARR